MTARTPAPSSSPVLSAILVNYNAGDELRRALQSIADEMHGQPWEAVVVDNVSIDGSTTIVDEFAPAARLIRNTVNVGFGRAVNQGLAATTSPLVLIMNPDCRLVAGATTTLRAVLEQHQNCAIVGPRILNPDGSVQGSARGDPDMLTGLFGRTTLLQRMLPWLSVSKRNVLPVDAAADASGIVVDWVSGACMLARRSALAAVDGFDERYFLYWEDADLCRRLRGRGYETRYEPAASAIHRVGHSSRTVQAVAIRAFHESAYLYYCTHVAPEPLSPKRPLARALLGARAAWARYQARRRSIAWREPQTSYARISSTRSATCSAIERLAVNPGDSMPAACTRRGHLSSLAMKKSAYDTSGGWILARMPLPPSRRSASVTSGSSFCAGSTNASTGSRSSS
jgi:GT2 family glycosyltransferase